MLYAGLRLADRYRLDARLGAGGMGEVWRAVDEVLGRVVAVKAMLPEVADQPDFAKRFLVEAQAMASVNHPAVASIHDYGRGTGITFLVMEFIDGESLSQVLARAGRLDPATTMRLITQAADGLRAVHERGIVHRDIKPANLLIRRDGTLLITDFGISRTYDGTQLTASGAVLGTPTYLSPEQVLGRPATGLSDVYSLGLAAYECLAGRRPFEGDNPYAVALQRLQTSPPPLGADIPGPVLAVVERALATDPAHRWQSAAAMADAARRAIDLRPEHQQSWRTDPTPAPEPRNSAPTPPPSLGRPVSGPLAGSSFQGPPVPLAGPPSLGRPVSGPLAGPSFQSPPVSAPPAGPSSLGRPVSAPPAGPSSQGRPVSVPPAGPERRTTRRRLVLLVAVLLVVVVGGVVTRQLLGPGSDGEPGSGSSAGPVAGAGPSGASALPTGFVTCGTMFCPAEPMCWAGTVASSGLAYSPRVRACTGQHAWETFAATVMPRNLRRSEEDSLITRAEFAAACSAEVMAAHSRDTERTDGWRRDAWPIEVPGTDLRLVHCLAAPNEGGDTSGSMFS